MLNRKFKRTVENFTCGNCGFFVSGDGFTNHCPKCLFSKHIDVNPGDREEICQGLMEPIAIEQKNNKYYIIHKCQQCRFQKRNKVNSQDNQDKILAIT